MLVKKEKKTSILILVLIFIIIFYYMLRVTTLVDNNEGNWELELFTIAINNIYKINTPINISTKNVFISEGVSFFVIIIYETLKMQNKKNIQENTYGSAEWNNSKILSKKRDPVFENNMILTQTELVSKNMKKSKMNRHVMLIRQTGYR